MRTSTFSLLAIALSASPAAAQPLDSGTKLLVTVPHPFDGPTRRGATFQRVGGDTLWVSMDGRSQPLDLDLATPHIRTEETRSTAGALLGLAAGAAAGAIWASSSYEPTYSSGQRCIPAPGATLGSLYGATCSSLPRQETSSRTLNVTLAAATGGLVGGLLGYSIGSSVRKWAPVDVEAIRAGPGGVAVTIVR